MVYPTVAWVRSGAFCLSRLRTLRFHAWMYPWGYQYVIPRQTSIVERRYECDGGIKWHSFCYRLKTTGIIKHMASAADLPLVSLKFWVSTDYCDYCWFSAKLPMGPFFMTRPDPLIPQWSDQYSNMPHRSGTLLSPSLKLFNEGLLTLFLLLLLLHCLSFYTGAGWHFISSSKTRGSLWTFFRNICRPDNCLHHILPPLET